MRRTAARKATELTLEDEIAQLRDLDLHGLRARWKTMLRRQSPPHLPRHLLFAVLAYRLQADQMRDITPDTARLLKQIGASRTTLDAMHLASGFDRRRIELKPGSILTRGWNGRHDQAMVVDEGFAWNGKTYDSLSDVAFAITGTKWNGPRFFGLRDKGSAEANQ